MATCSDCSHFEDVATATFVEALNPFRIRYWCNARDCATSPSDDADDCPYYD